MDYQEVKVEWVDSCSGDSAWTFIEDFKPNIAHPITYGFLIYEDEEMITVAQTYAPAEGDMPAQLNGYINIPKCSIVKLSKLS